MSLNRERQANSLSLALLEELQNILTQINEEANTRVVILTGAGEKAFCAGADLKERAGMNDEQVRHAVSMIRTTMEMVEQLPQPVIA
ncbi:enoyl-CoA hydratase-related protein, partial [Bacillus sp. D-CC]